jgi:hypothetical protein
MKRRSSQEVEAPDQPLLNFLEGYRRISLADACAYDIDPAKDLALWVNRDGLWQSIPASNQALRTWSAAASKSRKSVCRSLVMDLFGLRQAEYEQVRSELENQNGVQLTGVYMAKDDNVRPTFAVVMRLPRRVPRQPLKSQAGTALVPGGIGAVAGVAAGVLAKHWYDKNKKLEPHVVSESSNRPKKQSIEGIGAESMLEDVVFTTHPDIEAQPTLKVDKLADTHAAELLKRDQRKRALTQEVASLTREIEGLRKDVKHFQQAYQKLDQEHEFEQSTKSGEEKIRVQALERVKADLDAAESQFYQSPADLEAAREKVHDLKREYNLLRTSKDEFHDVELNLVDMFNNSFERWTKRIDLKELLFWAEEYLTANERIENGRLNLAKSKPIAKQLMITVRAQETEAQVTRVLNDFYVKHAREFFRTGRHE